MSLGYVKNTQEGRGAKDAQKCIFLLKMHFCASLACVYPLTTEIVRLRAFGRFRPASTWRHNPVPFISQVPGGYYAGLTPPFIPVFVSFYFAYTTTASGRPRAGVNARLLVRSLPSAVSSECIVTGRGLWL